MFFNNNLLHITLFFKDLLILFNPYFEVAALDEWQIHTMGTQTLKFIYKLQIREETT